MPLNPLAGLLYVKYGTYHKQTGLSGFALRPGFDGIRTQKWIKMDTFGYKWIKNHWEPVSIFGVKGVLGGDFSSLTPGNRDSIFRNAPMKARGRRNRCVGGTHEGRGMANPAIPIPRQGGAPTFGVVDASGPVAHIRHRISGRRAALSMPIGFVT